MITKEQMEQILEVTKFEAGVSEELEFLKTQGMNDEFIEGIKNIFYSDEFKEKSLEIYNKYFTTEDIEEIIAYHKNPVIKKWAETYKTLMQESQQMLGELIDKSMPGNPFESKPVEEKTGEEKTGEEENAEK